MLALVAATTLGAPAAAQQKTASDPTADELVQQGEARFEAKDYDGARQAFASAYELQPTPEVLLDLALAEMNSKRVIDGIRHLRAYVRMASAPAARVASVRETLLPKAYAKVARVSVNLPDGTAVQLDDRSETARAGEDESLIVLPGAHTLRTADGRKTVFTAEAGGVLSLTLPPLAASRPIAPGSISTGQSAALAPSAPERPLSLLGAGKAEAATSPSNTEDAAGFWDTRAVVLTIGASVTLVALGAGVYFLSKESSDQEKVDARREELRNRYGTPNSCLEGRVGAADPWCQELSELVDTKVHEQNLATASLIAAGVVGAGTVAGLFLWPRAGRRNSAVLVAPAIARGTAGVMLSGEF